MSIKKLTRVACVTAIAGIAVFTGAFSGCTIETKHPHVEITIEFNEVEYDLEFQLYRNMYPQTVKHFIELANAKFYDNTIIHNYNSRDWYGGGYSFVDEETYKSAYDTAGGLEDYLIENSKEQTYYEDLFQKGLLTPSVYKTFTENYKGDTPLSTLIGEFSANDHEIQKGALTSQLGALRMYYHSGKTYDGEKTSEKVWVETTRDDEAFERDYGYNSATSMFAVQVGTSSDLTTSKYCIFGHLNSDADLEKLEELKDAIADYIADAFADDSSDFVQTVEVAVDHYEEIADKGTDVSYSVTAKPLIVKTVKVLKY
ncbi:MAG: peptidylprolyl isomerase [Clostridia bacterium]|nr:peptidylprolyl isomerase [Clostridia bacterium]